jgi:adenylate cyclase
MSEELEQWLRSAPHVADGGQTFVRELASRLRAAGLPIWRMSLALLNKHPELLWRTVQWHEHEGVNAIEREHRTALDAFFTDSPVAALRQGTAAIRERLEHDEPRYPIGRDLKQQGGTDYYAQGLRFSNGEISYVSWATREPGGFASGTLAALERLLPALAQRVELESAYHATRSLLEVYLGKNAARRVLDGQFRRGGGELIRAAIWFCDLRGFTAVSDRSSPEHVVEMLDAYFERVAGAITERGGEVLKFIGDAILAIFPLTDGDAEACRRALAAAEAALAALEPPLVIGIALHVGDVMYGNIGSRERLDFTVISAAVNETSRLEGLCKVLGTRLTLSSAFVAALGDVEVIDLGEQDLKGVRDKLRVYTLPRFAPG